MQVIFTQSNETTLVKMYATSTVLLWVVHHYFILNHALSTSDRGPHAVRRIPWTSQDLPFVFPQTEAPMLSRGSLGHPGILPSCPLRQRPPCCPEDPLDIPGSSLRVPSDRGLHAVRRIPWTSRDPPFVSPQTQAPMLSGGSLGHPGILPWCPLRHRPPCCLEYSW